MPGAGTDKTKNWVREPAPVVVLVETQLGDNIGSAARAMANFGLSRLRLVKPREPWPNARARVMASGADRILDDAELFDTLEALALIEPIPGGFDPDKHEGPYTDFLEPGDDYYQMAPWLAAAIKRLRKAEGAVSEPTQP